MTVGSLSPVRALSISDGACTRHGRAKMRAKSGGWGMGWLPFGRELFRPGGEERFRQGGGERFRQRGVERFWPGGEGGAGHAGNARAWVKVFLSCAAAARAPAIMLYNSVLWRAFSSTG